MRSEKVLVSLKPYLGDAVMVQPAVLALAQAGAEVFVQTSNGGAELLGAGASHVPYSSAKSLLSVAKEARRLQAQGFQVAVLANLSFRSALTCRLARIPRRVGHSTEGRSFLLTHRVAFDPTEFQGCSVARLLEPLGLEVANHRPRLAFPGSMDRAKELVGGATVGFHPGARDPWKRIPLEKVCFVLEGLFEAGHTVAMFGGKEESEGAQALRDRFGGGLVDLVGRTSIPETVAAFSGLGASFGGDTGVMHLSAASGCPTVQVFGSDRAGRWGHGYAPHRVMKASENDLAKVAAEEILRTVLELAG